MTINRTDIRKPATQKASISRPVAHPTSAASSNPTRSNSAEGFVDYTEPLSDDEEEDDEDNRLKGTATNEADWVGDLGHAEVEAAKAYRENHVREEAAKAAKRDDAGPSSSKAGTTKVKEIFTKLTPANLTRLLNSKYDLDRDRSLNSGTTTRSTIDTSASSEGTRVEPLSDEQVNESGFALNPGRIEYVSTFRAGPGKRIAIPVRIEPKVFYANERTSKIDFFFFSSFFFHRP